MKLVISNTFLGVLAIYRATQASADIASGDTGNTLTHQSDEGEPPIDKFPGEPGPYSYVRRAISAGARAGVGLTGKTEVGKGRVALCRQMRQNIVVVG